MFPLTIPYLLRIMPRCPAVEWVGPLEQAAAAFDITTPQRMAMWLANIAHESAELLLLEESFYYRTPARLRAIFPKHFPTDEEAARYVALGPVAMASKVYANRLGNGNEASQDGWVYRGMGPIGVTFKSNYIACSIAICGDADTLLKNPEFLQDPEFGAASAGWYWDSRDCNKAADAGNFDTVCDLINIGRRTISMGDSNGFSDRLGYYQAALAAAR